MKEAKLRSTGTLNRSPEKVKSKLFESNSFFDGRDLMQLKYEMLRAVVHENHSVSECCAQFGLSRTAFYHARTAYENEGLAGLIADKPGPKRASKLTDEVLSALRQYAADAPGVSLANLQEFVKTRFNIDIHPRTIKRRMNGAKKNSRGISR